MPRSGTSHEEELLQAIVGEQLSSVEFVQDYVQLRFDGPTLTAFTWPVITNGDRTYRFGADRYRDELCDRIAKHVRSAKVKRGDVLHLVFDDGSAITISLHPDDYRGPEAVKFDVDSSGWWVL